jgi:hypothetical protein
LAFLPVSKNWQKVLLSVSVFYLLAVVESTSSAAPQLSKMIGASPLT